MNHCQEHKHGTLCAQIRSIQPWSMSVSTPIVTSVVLLYACLTCQQTQNQTDRASSQQLLCDWRDLSKKNKRKCSLSYGNSTSLTSLMAVQRSSFYLTIHKIRVDQHQNNTEPQTTTTTTTLSESTTTQIRIHHVSPKQLQPRPAYQLWNQSHRRQWQQQRRRQQH